MPFTDIDDKPSGYWDVKLLENTDDKALKGHRLSHTDLKIKILPNCQVLKKKATSRFL